jgi:hypothetical protein
MKLNPECIRAIMLYLEENLTMNSDLEINEISVFDLPRKINFSIEEIANTLLVLDDAGFIVCYRNDGDDAIVALDVYRITYTGYQFLESVRSDTVWKKVQKISGNVGSFSLNVISQIATSVLAQMVNGQLNL